MRAKTIFLHNSILMLERSDINGDLARARYATAQKANFPVTPTSNRAFYVKRYLDELNMQLEKNEPSLRADTMTTTSRITIADKNDAYRPKVVDMYTNSRSLINTPTQNHAQTALPTHITIATDGSLKDGEARYGFIALTQSLLEQWRQSMHKLTDTKHSAHNFIT